MGTATGTQTPRSDWIWSDSTGAAQVKPDGNIRELPTVARAYRLASYGDSRSHGGSSNIIGTIGSGAYFEPGRFPAWAAAYMGDAEIAGNFAVSGDTLISSSSTTGWNGPTRSYSHTFANLIAGGYDGVFIQYGINDLPTATSANLILAAKAMVSKMVAAGLKVCLQNIQIFDPTAATPNITPANAAATLVKINAFRDAMSAWIATMPGRAVFADPNPLLVDGTGYGDPQYFSIADTLGVHPNKRGAQIMGYQAAQAMRTLLPARLARSYTSGPLSQPNLIDWSGTATNLAVSNSSAGTTTSSAPTWNIDSVTGVPYAEATITPTVLASGRALARFEVWATDIAGATPKHAISIGDVMQGSARVVMDDGAGGIATGLQSVNIRHRLYNNASASQFFGDWGGQAGTDLTTMPLLTDCRFVTAPCVSPIASATIGTPAAGLGYYFAVFIETTTLAPVRVRIYAPALRVISRAQPTTVTAGASPYKWTNNPQPFVANEWVNSAGQRAMVTVAPGSGGTISQIAITRGASISGTFANPVNTGLTSGVFTLMPGDGLIVTWATTAAVLTVTYMDD